jgi:adenine-specific DNA-methyltransferase
MGVMKNINKQPLDHLEIQNRRYIGNKFKLNKWIFDEIKKECKSRIVFADIFSGTGVVAAEACKHFDQVIINDFLHSNFAIYNAFFGKEKVDDKKINSYIDTYNSLTNLKDNYFSNNFGGKFFSVESSRKIGFIRDDIEKNKNKLTSREYFTLIAILIYAVDKIANTVGHFDAYFKKKHIVDNLVLKPIKRIESKKIKIYQKDANELVKKLRVDVAYIDPPYNSRQYSRFYHVLETLTKWDKPKLFGVALKPAPENTSDYCKTKAKDALQDLVDNLDAKYLIVSYNNTYDSKSNSSKNKITLDQIKDILDKKGKTKVFKKSYKHFNAGNTEFKNHHEYLFITKVKNSD